MKIKALQDFNLGSLTKDYKAGQTVEVTDSVAKELIDAKLAKEVTEKAAKPEAEKPVDPNKREVKPDATDKDAK